MALWNEKIKFPEFDEFLKIKDVEYHSSQTSKT